MNEVPKVNSEILYRVGGQWSYGKVTRTHQNFVVVDDGYKTAVILANSVQALEILPAAKKAGKPATTRSSGVATQEDK